MAIGERYSFYWGEPESDDPYKETYGTNLVATLRYKEPEMPTLDVFEKREWLYLTHHDWKDWRDPRLCLMCVAERGFRKAKDRFVRVGAIQLHATDPRTAHIYCSWSSNFDDMYLQDRWDRGIRD
jgi:hypothetical protein